jgi:site-specific recombinase XerD
VNITLSKIRRKHIDKNKKRQVAIRVKVKKPKAEFDFNVLKKNGDPLKLNDSQYSSLTMEYYNLIESNKEVMREAVNHLIENSGTFNRKSIEQRIIELSNLNFLDVVSGYQRSRTRLSEDETIGILNEIDESADQIEDISDILVWEESELRKKEHENKILDSNKIKNPLTRTKHQYSLMEWDRDNVILAIGYLFTFEKDNGDPLIPSIYRSLLNNLYEYQLSTATTNYIKLYNEEYCRAFIKYIIRSGVIKSSLGSTPFELNSGKYDYFFKENEKRIIAYSTLKDKIKAINSFNKYLYRMDLIRKRIDEFKPDNFVTNTVITKKGSNVDHRLSVKEVQELINTTIEDHKLNLVKDIFLTLVFAGGLRGIENFDVLIDQENDNLDILHSKGENRCIIPISKEMRGILEKYEYKFPDFDNIKSMPIELRRLANYLGWNRDIKTVNTFVNRMKGDDYYFFAPINESFDLTFARKTFVNYARKVYGMTDKEIIHYTGHASVDILAHYMGEYTLEEMRSRLNQNKD